MVDFKILVDQLPNHDRQDGPAGFSNGNGTTLTPKDMIPNVPAQIFFRLISFMCISVKYQQILHPYDSF